MGALGEKVPDWRDFGAGACQTDTAGTRVCRTARTLGARYEKAFQSTFTKYQSKVLNFRDDYRKYGPDSLLARVKAEIDSVSGYGTMAADLGQQYLGTGLGYLVVDRKTTENLAIQATALDEAAELANALTDSLVDNEIARSTPAADSGVQRNPGAAAITATVMPLSSGRATQIRVLMALTEAELAVKAAETSVSVTEQMLMDVASRMRASRVTTYARHSNVFRW